MAYKVKKKTLDAVKVYLFIAVSVSKLHLRKIHNISQRIKRLVFNSVSPYNNVITHM